MTDSSETETETTPRPQPSVVASPSPVTMTMSAYVSEPDSVSRFRSGSSPPGPTYSFTPKIRPPPADLAHRPPRLITTTINAPTTSTSMPPLSPLKSPRSILQSLGLRKAKKPSSSSSSSSNSQPHHHHHYKSTSLSSPKTMRNPVSPVEPPPVRPPRSPPLPPASSSRYSSLLDKPLPPPPLDLEQNQHHHQTRRSEEGMWPAKHHGLRWDAPGIKAVRATV